MSQQDRYESVWSDPSNGQGHLGVAETAQNVLLPGRHKNRKSSNYQTCTCNSNVMIVHAWYVKRRQISCTKYVCYILANSG